MKNFSSEKLKEITYCCLPSDSREVYRVGLLVPDKKRFLT